jgi:hypothetical protein
MSAASSSGIAADDIKGITSALRPTNCASHRPTLGARSAKEGVTVSIVGWCGAEGRSAAGERLASGAGFLIFWITNLWRGGRLNDMTLNRAPLIAHLNSTSLSSRMRSMDHTEDSVVRTNVALVVLFVITVLYPEMVSGDGGHLGGCYVPCMDGARGAREKNLTVLSMARVV